LDLISGKVLGVAETAGLYISDYKMHLSFIVVLDILIVSVLIYWIYLFLHQTRAMRILYGLFILLILMLIGRFLNLILLNWILKYVMASLVVAIPIVFQPELRAALEKLGRSKLWGEFAFVKEDYIEMINQLAATVTYFSKNRIGALIIIQRQTGLREYIESGSEIDAVVSKSILSSIFYPKSPLHDGAVIIVGNRIISAGSILPVSDAVSNTDLGTRHRSAIGITENSDAIAIVVSEETGIVSIATYGKLERRISEERLINKLLHSFKQNKKKNA